MAHTEQLDFIRSIRGMHPRHFSNKRVLEVGSLNINGSVRQFFSNCDYLGIDVGPGEGVDIVCPGQDYNAPDESFDTIISTECFEHNPYWRETFANMVRMTKSNGLILFTCATTGRKEHGTNRTCKHSSPLTIDLGWGDYYQNLTENDFRKEFNFTDAFESHQFSNNLESFDLYFYGIKKATNRIPIDLQNIYRKP